MTLDGTNGAGLPTKALPDLRQVVLLTADLEDTLATARAHLEVPHGFRDVTGMAAIGFVHEVFGFEHTYVEVCQPADPDSRLGQRVATRGDFGFMVVVQVDDVEAMVGRARGIGIEPLFVKDHHGNTVSQWHPRDFGTLAEFDQIRPADAWHFAPDVYEARGSSIVDDIVAVHVSVPNPEEMARRWAVVLDATLEDDGTSVNAGGRSVHFADVPATSGLHAVDCRAADPRRIGSELPLGGVAFRFV